MKLVAGRGVAWLVVGLAGLSTCGGAALSPRSPDPAEPDPSLAFRLQYASPGGMWLPQQMTLPEHVQALHDLGVRFDVAQLADPRAAPLGAVVWLGDCTASFVSPDGLILTNHHCVQEMLAGLTDRAAGRNLLEDGFLASRRSDERPSGAARHVLIAQAFRDVTAQMRDGLEKFTDPAARVLDIERRTKLLYAPCDRRHVRCHLRSYLFGALYLMTESSELRDLRLVYAPPRSVGDYGGEVDNWKWPRHTGDWALIRAYVTGAGVPAPYGPRNVPYHPDRYLHVTTAGLAPGDFVMAIGYPGWTNRMRTAASLRREIEWTLPSEIALCKAKYAAVDRYASDPSETGTKAIVMRQEIQNTLARDEVLLAGLTQGDLLAQRTALDGKIKDWAADPARRAQREAIEKLDQLDDPDRGTARSARDFAAVLGGSALLRTAGYLTEWAAQRRSPDVDRPLGFQDAYLFDAATAQRQLTHSFDRALDRAVFRIVLVRALEIPAADRPWLARLLEQDPAAAIDEALIDHTLDAWYRAPPLADEDLRLTLLRTGTLEQLAATKDPFLAAVLRVWPAVQDAEHRRRAVAGERALLEPAYGEAVQAVLGRSVAPDANSSLRITYGTVRSFKPGSSDPADRPFTVASQIAAKNTGVSPFNAPAGLLSAIRARRFGRYADPALGGDLPIDFLSDLDISGGNSGSPVINRRGELVGVLFDSAEQGVLSDISYDPATSRSISVDVRYLAWTLDVLAGGGGLLAEMGIAPTHE